MNKIGLFRNLVITMLSAMILCVSVSAFSDVPDSHWAAESIHRSVEQGIFNGETANSFGTGKPMTRAAFLTALCRFFQWDTSSVSTPYADVEPDAWYAGAVTAAYANGAVTSQNSVLRPNDTITREEMAVMLVRALGYGTISGLSQSHPFSDVTTNSGYISMAYEMGLVNGISENTFAPDSPATREQAAVLLMRLYDKLHTEIPSTVALISEWPEAGMDLSGYDVVALNAGYYAVAGQTPVLSRTMSESTVDAILSAAHRAGAKVLFYASARETILKADPTEIAALLVNAAQEWGCDGIWLEVQNVSAKNQPQLTALSQSTDSAAGQKLFYLTASFYSNSTASADYAALSAAADQLVIRISTPAITSDGFTIAPAEQPEELYCALRDLKDLDNIAILLSAAPSAWRGVSSMDAPTADEIEAYLSQGVQRYYSQRYESPYLRLSSNETIWYADGESAAARLQLMQLMGVSCFCVSNPEAASMAFLAELGVG